MAVGKTTILAYSIDAPGAKKFDLLASRQYLYYLSANDSRWR